MYIIQLVNAAKKTRYKFLYRKAFTLFFHQCIKIRWLSVKDVQVHRRDLRARHDGIVVWIRNSEGILGNRGNGVSVVADEPRK